MRPFLVLTLLLLAPLAQAKDWEGVAEWRVIAGDGSYTSSHCIGSNKTLDCLADTIAACGAWSDPPRFALDPADYAEGYEPAVCSVGGDQHYFMQQALRPFGPARTQLFLYQIDTWVLNSPKDWIPIPEYQALVQAGDVVIDYFSLTCSPNPGCLEGKDLHQSAERLLAQCPQTFCGGGKRFWPTADKNDPSKAINVQPPWFSVVARETSEGWIIVDWYDFWRFGIKGVPWYADHWVVPEP